MVVFLLSLGFRYSISAIVADDSIEVGKEENSLYWPTCEFKPFSSDDVEEFFELQERQIDDERGEMVNNNAAVFCCNLF